MIKVKHMFDRVEADDGARVWVEPVGLTKDLQEWCAVNWVLPHLGPPPEVWNWFERHPDGYEYFRALYHAWLDRSPLKAALQQLAVYSMNVNCTLIHAGDDLVHNSASALAEFVIGLAACSPRPQ